MNMGYTKLFSQIVSSTIWAESDRTRLVWVTMLALCDKNGEVQASIPGLARLAGVPLEDCEVAIKKFLGPDPYSRTPDDEGRRIEKIDGGWALLNHAKYRNMASKEESKSSNSERQKRYRERSKRNATVTHSNATVTHGRDIADTDTDTDTDTDKKYNTPQPPKGERVCVKSPDQIRVEKLYRRKESTKWSAGELKAWKIAGSVVADTSPENWATMEWWFWLPPEKAPYRKTDMAALLNNWHAEIEKARRNKAPQTYSEPARISKNLFNE